MSKKLTVLDYISMVVLPAAVIFSIIYQTTVPAYFFFVACTVFYFLALWGQGQKWELIDIISRYQKSLEEKNEPPKAVKNAVFNRKNYQEALSKVSQDELNEIATEYMTDIELSTYSLLVFLDKSLPPFDASDEQLDQWPLSITGDDETSTEFQQRSMKILALLELKIFFAITTYLHEKKEHEDHHSRRT